MKKAVLFLSAVVLGINIFANNPSALPECADTYYPEKIKVLMQSHENFYTGRDLSGKVKITFTLNDDNTFKVLDVDSENIYLENHALQSLNNYKIDNQCLDNGKVYSITVDFIYVI
ncbi:MAG: hypothetical protein H7Y00_05565 [Fimbriimonadaceae bacterium]|nr:hypothetical protein [Chitinophagales bacterium]